MRLYRNDVVVVGKLAGFGGEAEVCDGWDFEVGDVEALRPVTFRLVLHLELEGLVLEVGELGDGRYLGITNATSLRLLALRIVFGMCMAYRAPSDLVRLAVVVLIIDGRSVAIHSHDVREDGAWSVVLIRVEEDTESLELVCVTEDIARLRALLGEPHSEAVAIQVALAGDLELELNLLA
jgi:hypothetical protein